MVAAAAPLFIPQELVIALSLWLAVAAVLASSLEEAVLLTQVVELVGIAVVAEVVEQAVEVAPVAVVGPAISPAVVEAGSVVMEAMELGALPEEGAVV